ncbi:MAG: YHS domain-containing protein [Gemmatimonadaceae bacterium]
MAQAKDPVCGMIVETGSAARKTVYQSQTYYFCSSACSEKFEANPAKYVSRQPADVAQPATDDMKTEPPFTQSGGLTSPKFGSAGSGGLEYEGIPESRDKK